MEQTTVKIDMTQERDFKIYDALSDLPLDKHPAYLKEGFSGICTGGSALIDVYSHKRRVVKNDLIVIFPYQLSSIREISEDFSIRFFKISSSMFLDTMSGLCRMTPDFYFFMRKHFSYKLVSGEAERFNHFLSLLNFRADAPKQIFRRETIMHLLRVFYWDIYVSYKNNAEFQKQLKFTHKEDIAFKFFVLIMEHHSENREVAFYADKLCISPKYLTMVIKEISGKSAKDWIVEYTLLEIKALLRDSNCEIKEVVRRTHFPSQSLLSRFFRKHTGMSPSQYRESIHI